MELNKKKNAQCEDLIMIRTLGAGYNAKVKLAYDKQSGQYVAVKIIKKIDRNHLKTLQNELNIMVKLKHPGIVQLLDVQENKAYVKKNGASKTVTFIVLELADGGELFDYVANTGAFCYITARSYFAQLLDALDFAQAKNIAHRDLKPENLLFDKEFRLKVADWGFACHRREGEKSHTVLGTESYMAPEIHLKIAYDAHAADLFAAAIVLFIMVVGTPPFTRADTKDPYYNLLAQGKHERFWQQHLKFKGDKNFFTPEFKEMLTRMLAYDPAQRMTLQQVRQCAWMAGPVFSQQELTQQFTSKKATVDKEIEVERQRKLMEKQRMGKPNAHTAMAGFRSGPSVQPQGFDQLMEDFPLLSLERNLTALEDAPEQSEDLGLGGTNTIFSFMEAPLLLKYLLLTLLEVKVLPNNITLSAKNKFKLSFCRPDEDEENMLEAQVRISRKDRAVNQISFLKVQGETTQFHKMVNGIKKSFQKITINL